MRLSPSTNVEAAGQVPRRPSRNRATGQAPSDVFDTTVNVVSLAGWCTERNDTPAS